MLLIVLVLAVIYGLMAYVAAGVLPVEEVAGKNLALSVINMPYWLFVIFYLVAILCDFVIIYNLFVGLKPFEMGMMVVLLLSSLAIVKGVIYYRRSKGMAEVIPQS